MKPHSAEDSPSRPSEITAVSIEFVAKPCEAKRLATMIPAEIARALKHVSGFAGCLVMISDQEARLVTVVTLWEGEDRTKRSSQNARCVNSLLAPFLDRYLRVQVMVAHLPVLPVIRPHTMDPKGPPVKSDRESRENFHFAS
jgi:hypothetical protein